MSSTLELKIMRLYRKAKCHCGNVANSSESLFGYEYTGLGSRRSENQCKCGYDKEAHERSERRVYREPIQCREGGFTPRGPMEFDIYYCGCGGWD